MNQALPRAWKPGLESRAAFWLAALVLVQFLPIWARGLTPFWGDLTYLHHPWRALPLQMLQAGQMPLWNPYLYFGMPMAAQMQGSLFHPATLLYYFFGFATATALFHGLIYWFSGWFMFLWLRRLGLRRFACLAGATAYILGGGLLSRVSFINHLAVLSLLPALLIFFDRPILLALTLLLAFLGGYPPFLLGGAVLAWFLALVLTVYSGKREGRGRGPRRITLTWIIGGSVAAVLGAFLLIPAYELAAECRRTTSGMDLSETLTFGFGLRDLVQWISPVLVPWSKFDPAVEWWKASYIGFGGALAAAVGLFSVKRRVAAGLLTVLVATLVLILGDTNPLSLAVWTHFPPLKLVRYPGNMVYLALPVLSLLIAAGLQKSRKPLLLAILAAELTVYGINSFPLAPRDLFNKPGPLVSRLQEDLAGHRYLLTPLALEAHKGLDVWDWKWRLYGLTNAPARIRAGGNFGQPLVPKGSYDLMDFLYSQQSADAAARYLPWADVSALLSPVRIPASASGLLTYQAKELWEIHRVAGPAPAFLLNERDADLLSAKIGPELPREGVPLVLDRGRADRFSVVGRSPEPGWAYIAEPLYPGWKVVLSDGSGRRAVRPEPALSAFQKVRVPAGDWILDFRYDPGSWRWGILLALFGFLGLGAYGYGRVLRLNRVQR